jgi:hypothetical protein
MNENYESLASFIKRSAVSDVEHDLLMGRLNALFGEAQQHSALASLVDQFLAAAVFELPMSDGESLLGEVSRAEA